MIKNKQFRWVGICLALLVIGALDVSDAVARGGRIVKKEFCHNGCSTSFGLARPWEFTQCCALHDLAYYIGGDYTERDRADENLRLCVQKTAHRNGSSDVSSLYIMGVSSFGDEFWGSAWGQTRATAWDFLDANEKAQIAALNLPKWTEETTLHEVDQHRCPTFSSPRLTEE